MALAINTNIDVMGMLSGHLLGTAEGMDEEAYIDAIIDDAHSRATNLFDLAAAATARTGRFSHMYEFGTAGITRGPTVFVDPTKPEARLYQHISVGHGGRKNFTFNFRPAAQPNPRPTTRETGIPSKYLRKLSRRKYVFRQRAMVTETGREVEINAVSGRYLFIPTYGETKKGFVLYDTDTHGPIEMTPGRTNRGQFSAFWVSWWASQGQSVMNESMTKAVAADMEKSETELSKRTKSRPLKPARANSVKRASVKAKAASRSLVKSNTARRRRTK